MNMDAKILHSFAHTTKAHRFSERVKDMPDHIIERMDEEPPQLPPGTGLTGLIGLGVMVALVFFAVASVAVDWRDARAWEAFMEGAE